ncbi:hypothetical protein OIO90_006303 [Microbotryomycetes sp. JL221]|nr:hypothetical protein OIO90_006303 [Microbotryomycetes sp. JL221]
MVLARQAIARTVLLCTLAIVVLATLHALVQRHATDNVPAWLQRPLIWSNSSSLVIQPKPQLIAQQRQDLQPNPLYSSVDCHGTEGVSNPVDNKCRFRNVCLELLPLPQNRAMLDADKDNAPEYAKLYYYRPSWLKQAPLYWFKGYAHKEPWSRIDWAGTLKPTIMDDFVPVDSWWSTAPTTILTEAWWPENFGHALGDDYLPIYRLAKYFDQFDSKDLSVIFHPSCHDRGSPGDEMNRGCSHHQEMSNLLFDLPTIDLNSSSLFKKEGSKLCFRQLLIGTGGLRMGTPAEASVWTGFAETIKERARVRTNVLPSKQRISIMFKPRKRTLKNYDALEQHLKDRFQIEVKILDPNQLSLTEQLQELQQTTVLVSPCGGISFSATFLPRGASAVFVDYWDTRYNRSFSMEKYVFTQMSHLSSYYYTVEKKDVSYDIEDVWWGDRENEWIIYRNYADVTINLRRMEDYVLAALAQAEVALDLRDSFKRE